MKKFIRCGVDKETVIFIIPTIGVWTYEGHFGIQLTWLKWSGWVVFGKNS